MSMFREDGDGEMLKDDMLQTCMGRLNDKSSVCVEMGNVSYTPTNTCATESQ